MNWNLVWFIIFSILGCLCIFHGIRLMIKENACKHIQTHQEGWPDGGSIEVCDDCTKSRYHWEQGSSDWILVKDIDKERDTLQKFLDGLEEPKKRGDQ